MMILQLILLIITCFNYNVNGYVINNNGNKIGKINSLFRLNSLSTSYPELEKCLIKEYATFFAPLNRKFYTNDVTFIDPLNTFSGIDNYQNNVDMLAGRTTLGSILFEDASIILHNVKQINDKKIQTRWTLQVTIKLLPWRPRAKFTGISVYSLNDNGIVTKQEDYWDSINLKDGQYDSKSKIDGIKEFLNQLKNEAGAEMAAPELPYELLRITPKYEVRRYPKCIVAETTYDQRPEGYDRLGSYAGGSNVKDKKIPFYSPTIMRISDKSGSRSKEMTWPLEFEIPGKGIISTSTFPEPTIPKVVIKEKEGFVVAVLRFELAATEPIVRGFSAELIRDVKKDGMLPSPLALDGDCIIGQYDALFSLNKRRNEVWIELDNHPWL